MSKKDKRTNNEKLVSIIIPCFEQSHLLQRALDSVENQTYTNIEVIIIDDGSSSPVILPEKRYSFTITLNRITNKGLAGARNVGLKNIKGTYVKFLDADDALLPDCIAMQVESLGESNAISVIGFVEHDEDSGDEYIIQPAFGDLGEALLQVNLGPPHIYLFPVEAIKRVGGFYEGERVNGGHEDYDLLLRLYSKGLYAITVHKPGVIYYRRQGTMASHSENMDRTRAAVWAAAIDRILNSEETSCRLYLAAIAGWVKLIDVTLESVSQPLHEAAKKISSRINETNICFPESEIEFFRERLRRYEGKGGLSLLNALPEVKQPTNGVKFHSPQELIDRRIGFMH